MDRQQHLVSSCYERIDLAGSIRGSSSHWEINGCLFGRDGLEDAIVFIVQFNTATAAATAVFIVQFNTAT